jgi:hypothetical protein
LSSGGGKDIMDHNDHPFESFNELEVFLEILRETPLDQRHKLKETIDAFLLEVTSENDPDGGPQKDLLFIGSSGTHVVKCLHYPREVLGGDGPVLLPTSSKFIIAGAYSDEFINDRANEIHDSYSSTEDKNDAWAQLMNDYAVDIVHAYEQQPPPSFDALIME